MENSSINHPNLAETLFQKLCDLRNVVRNKATDDRKGWDYLLEFNRSSLKGFAHDRQPGNVTARVQVKSSVRQGAPCITLKLSNALLFTNEPDVCFLVLFQFERGNPDPCIYARHFDHDLMAGALKAARQADNAGKQDLNRVRITVVFSAADDHTHDLIEWVQAICDIQPESYAIDKRRLADRLGYERAAVHTKLTFSKEHIQAVINSTIGLERNVPVQHAIISDIRFGIKANTPLFEGEGSLITISANPRAARLIVESEGCSVCLDGELRSSFPIFPAQMAKASFITPCITLVFEGTKGFEFNFEMPPNSRYTIEQIIHVARTQIAFRKGGEIYLEIDSKKGWLATTLPWAFKSQVPDWLDQFLSTLLNVCPTEGERQISLEEIGTAQAELEDFANNVGDGVLSFQVELDTVASAMPSVRNLLDYKIVTIGKFVFWAILRRPCLEQASGKALASFRFGPPTILQSGSFSTEITDMHAQLTPLMRKWSERLGPGTVIPSMESPDPSV